MKSFDQLAQAAYEAYRKEMARKGEYVVLWDALLESEQEAWIAAAKQLWAEFAAMH